MYQYPKVILYCTLEKAQTFSLFWKTLPKVSKSRGIYDFLPTSEVLPSSLLPFTELVK